jgi:CPA1 family monovalent cation:H+ antiporter
MFVFELIVFLLLGAVLLAAAARRLGAPYPALLALGGTGLALVPGAPVFALEPDLALALFVAPVLLDAAYDTSTRDLKENWVPVAGLAVVAVGLTTAVVAVTAHALVPALPWAAAIALGAIVAPPDAAAATTVLRQVPLPHRLLSILEGESLLNDASALLVYRVAVGAAVAGVFSLVDAAPAFLLGVVGSIIAGPILARLFLLATRHVEDVPSAIVLQFIGTFGVWVLAERIGLSGVLTIVCYAIAIARDAPRLVPARLRVPSYAVWDTAVFVLNVLAFVIIGLQIRPILGASDPGRTIEFFTIAAAVLATVILVRIAWVMSFVAVTLLKIRLVGFRPPRPMMPPSFRGGLIVSWCGMRGIVTLAAAFALPVGQNGAGEFPFRDLIVFTAFFVVLGTLVVQGLTLRPLLELLDLRDDDPVGREVAIGRSSVYAAALEAIDGERSPEADALRREYGAMVRTAREAPHGKASAKLPGDDLRRRAVFAAREAVSKLRSEGRIGDEAFHLLEEELDRTELSVESRDGA